MEGEESLTAREAAEWLQVYHKTIYRMAKQGRLKGYSIRDRLCFRRTGVEQLLECRRTDDTGGSVAKNGFLTVKEVADLLLEHPVVIHRMMKEGRLRPYPIGGRLYFKREDIYALFGR